MTPSEQPPASDQQPNPTFVQSGQSVHGGQTNIAGAVNTGGGLFNAGTINLHASTPWSPYDPAAERLAHAPPPDFVARPTQLDQLRRWLLDPRHAPVAIVGPGGFGKTTLTQALANDPAICASFTHGLRWVQLAEEPGDLLSLISDLVVRLGRPRPDFRTLENATTALIEALGDQKILLVIDNVWHAPELAPLLKGGPNCVRLITTRDGSLVPASANILDLDVMTEGEAVQLLTANLPNAADLAAAELARQLYDWPLLLRLINSALHNRLTHEALPLAATWQSICQDLIDFGLTAFDDPKDAAARDRAVRASLNISLNQLTPAERACYAQLAIFPAAAIHWSALSRLWRLDLAQTRTLCRKLRTLSLLYLNETARTIRLHDVFRGYLQHAPVDNLTTLHQTFLTSYGLTRWHDLPATEPYLWDHLAYHLIAAERSAELAALFADDHWLQVRVAHDGYRYDGYLADLTQAWQLAHAAVHHSRAASDSSTQLAACVHYALIRTTINALAANYLPALVARAVATDLWPLDRALSIAYQVPDPQARAGLLTRLLTINSGTAVQRSIAVTRALEAALVIPDERSRVQALMALVPQLTEPQRIHALDHALQAALAIHDEGHRVETLVALAPQLTEPQRTYALDHALQAALAIQDEGSRVQVLEALAPQLTGPQRTYALDHALQAARALRYEGDRVEMLVALAPQLTGNLLDHALDHAFQAALAIQHEGDRIQALVRLAPQLTEPQRTHALDYALQVARALQYERYRVQALVRLAPELTGNLLDHALQAALAIQDEGHRVETLVALAPQLTEPQRTYALDHALQAALAIQYERYRVDALVRLAPQLTGHLLDHALQAALVLQFEWWRVEVLAALAPQLTGTQLDHALQAALAIQSERYRVETLVALAPQLTGHLLDHALQAALVIEDEGERVQALVRLAPQLTEPQRTHALDHALQVALAIQDERYRVETLVALAPQLTGHLLDHDLQAARALHDEGERVQALVALAPQLTGHLLDHDLDHALQVALAIEDEGERAQALHALLMRMPDTRETYHAQQTFIADHLRDYLQLQPRSKVLAFVTNSSLFAPPIVDQPALAAIAQSLVAICEEWRWL